MFNVWKMTLKPPIKAKQRLMLTIWTWLSWRKTIQTRTKPVRYWSLGAGRAANRFAHIANLTSRTRWHQSRTQRTKSAKVFIIVRPVASHTQQRLARSWKIHTFQSANGWWRSFSFAPARKPSLRISFTGCLAWHIKRLGSWRIESVMRLAVITQSWLARLKWMKPLSAGKANAKQISPGTFPWWRWLSAAARCTRESCPMYRKRILANV